MGRSLDYEITEKTSSRRCMFSSASITEKRGSTPVNVAASPPARCRSISSARPGLLARPRTVAMFTASESSFQRHPWRRQTCT